MKAFASLILAGIVASANAQSLGPAPKLVVVISVDQFRADYLERYADNFLPARSGKKIGGFRFLTETGSWFKDAHHNHVPTATGPGHATILSGSEPAVDGIPGNDWFNRAQNAPVYCVADPNAKTIGGPSKPMSPFNLKVTTVGDELKLATAGKSKIVSVALKDRAAILMAGHAADEVVWFDNGNGNWVTSNWYAPSGTLPTWVSKFNDSRRADKAYGTSWEPLLPKDAYRLTSRAPGEKTSPNSKLFSWPLGKADGKPDKGYWSALWTSHFGNELTEQAAEAALTEDKLGTHDVPDMLIVGFSSNDYIGHRFGPNSPEVMDATVRTDRVLSDLFNAIDRQVGIDNVVIALTADHGVLPIPEESANAFRNPGARQLDTANKAIADALTKEFGPGDWILGAGQYEQNFYLNRTVAEQKQVSMNKVEKVAAEAASKLPGVFAAFTRTQILQNELPAWNWVKRAVNGYHPVLGGDLMIFEAPGAYFGGGTGTGHGSIWEYDTHVPILLRGPGVNRGSFLRRVTTADIASSLCHLLHVEYPTGNMGQPLFEAIK